MRRKHSHTATGAALEAGPAGELVAKAKAQLALGQRDAAITLCRQAIAIEPCFNKAHRILARALMPGADYVEILYRIHRALKPESYCEIGIFEGKTLALATYGTSIVGIDPKPRIETGLDASTRIYPLRSDDFFEKYDLLKELRNRKLDLAFIDGLHHFDQVLRDFINIEKYAHKDTVVLLHDVYPPSAISAQRERVTNFWAGDTWKIIPCLKETRPDLAVSVIPSFPSGLGVVTNLDGSSTYLDANRERFTERFEAIPFSILDNDRDSILNVTENSWKNISKLIGVDLLTSAV